jgi:hypothetical protein
VVPPAAQDRYAAELIAKLAACAAGDPAKAGLRTETIEAWLRMAECLAHRYAGRGEPFDDLRQTATIGLIKAVDRFDPELGTDFATRYPPFSVRSVDTSATGRGPSVSPAASRDAADRAAATAWTGSVVGVDIGDTI